MRCQSSLLSYIFLKVKTQGKNRAIHKYPLDERDTKTRNQLQKKKKNFLALQNLLSKFSFPSVLSPVPTLNICGH